MPGRTWLALPASGVTAAPGRWLSPPVAAHRWEKLQPYCLRLSYRSSHQPGPEAVSAGTFRDSTWLPRAQPLSSWMGCVLGPGRLAEAAFRGFLPKEPLAWADGLCPLAGALGLDAYKAVSPGLSNGGGGLEDACLALP